MSHDLTWRVRVLQDPNKELLKLHQKHGESKLCVGAMRHHLQRLRDQNRWSIGGLTHRNIHRRQRVFH